MGPGCFVGPGRCVCRWAAARPRDRHTRAALGVVDLEARPGPAATHRHRGQAIRRPPHRRQLVSRSQARHSRRPRAPQPGPPDPPVLSTPATPGVRLCRLAPHPPCMRYKVRPARVVGGQSGTKFAQHARNSPKRAISSEQGEFYTAHAMRRGVQGDFCTGSGDVWLVQGEFCRALRHCSKALKSSTGTEARPSRVPLPSTSTKPATYADRLLRYG